MRAVILVQDNVVPDQYQDLHSHINAFIYADQPILRTHSVSLGNTSTAYFDFPTGLYYYGSRFYNPDTTKWLSRDPIGEEAVQRLYVDKRNAFEVARAKYEALLPAYLFVGNNPVNAHDAHGLLTETQCDQILQDGIAACELEAVKCYAKKFGPCAIMCKGLCQVKMIECLAGCAIWANVWCGTPFLGCVAGVFDGYFECLEQVPSMPPPPSYPPNPGNAPPTYVSW